MEDNVANRLKTFIAKEGLNSSQFADSCGIPRPSLSQLLSGRNKKISDVLVSQIHAAYPQLSVLWLLFGEGDMYAHGGPGSVAAESGGEELSETITAEGGDVQVSISVDRGLSAESSPSSQSGVNTESGSQRAGNTVGQSPGHSAGQPGQAAQTHSIPASATAAILAADYKNMALLKQIEAMKQNARRVVQITIYYDDSTFETFIPGK